jgi:3'(2'), 5'-bisphosphate nucleotidase
MKENLHVAIQAAIEGGKQILDVYAQDFSIFTKEDNSPLTEADRRAHEVIKDILQPTNLPLLSEEGKMIAYDERKNWDTFWLVDPLDGTKEFIKKNGEFTVNIALIKNGTPVLGVVYVPVTRMLYFGYDSKGSYCTMVTDNNAYDTEALESEASPLPLQTSTNIYTVVASRSHNTPETEAFIDKKREKYGEINMVSAGSSLKLCLVAEGKAQVYPRLAPTMEWDTAAGHAVAKFAGCEVYNFKTNTELAYNKENLLNPWFVVERIES